jgi:hypothetical protein
MSKPKPRQWIERFRIKRSGFEEHQDYINKHGFEDYLRRRGWELSDFEMGQINHPGVVFRWTAGALKRLKKLFP